uniref:Tyr recombinase domain-containing protein n=1 Tax=Trichogramma kaykai TaxID=54128 RepID=A0ABD2WY94_9HYME
MAIVIDQLSDEESFDEDDAETENRAFAAEAQRIKSNLLPTKSRGQYEKAYSAFIHWKTENRRSSSEDDLLVYFDKLSALYKPPTLWSHWSKLKSLMILKENINLDQYLLLKNLLKIKSKGYKTKKSAILTMEQVQKFLIDSNDNTYLAMKAILIFGIFGCLRCKEFLNILTTDITDTGSQYIVLIRDTKTGIDRNFVIGQQYYAERTEIFNKMAGPSSTEIQPPLQRNNMKKTSSVQPQIHASAQEQPSTSKYNLKTTPPVQSVTRTSAQKPPPRNGCNLEKRPFTYTVADDIENIDPADSPSQKMIDNFMNNDDPSEEALFQEITLDYHHTGNDVNETSAKRKKISNDNRERENGGCTPCSTS